MHWVCNVWKSKRVLSACICAFVLCFYLGFQLMFTPVDMKICPDAKTSTFYSDDGEITIVTMYLNIGKLKTKNSNFWRFSKSSTTSKTYKEWLLSWARLQNRVIAFFDDEDFITQFRLLRSHLPEEHTRIIRIDKNDLPAFLKRPQVEEIVADPPFEVTYTPTYTCTMNAKYDAMELALKYLETKYIAWMDIGLFRRLEEDHPMFTLTLPPGFNESSIGVSEVTPREKVAGLSPNQIYQKNVVWVAGGYILARRDILPGFISAYRKAVEELLSHHLADTDQQVLASMYSPQMIQQQSIFLEPYSCPRGSFNLYGYGYLYFCLPYICKESAECKKRFLLEGNNFTIDSPR